jgi:hypothetical protein
MVWKENEMRSQRGCRLLAAVVLALLCGAAPALAQVVSGRGFGQSYSRIRTPSAAANWP